MAQLVGDGFLVRAAFPEDNVVARGVRAGADLADRTLRGRPRVQPDIAEVRAQPGFHLLAPVPSSGCAARYARSNAARYGAGDRREALRTSRRAVASGGRRRSHRRWRTRASPWERTARAGRWTGPAVRTGAVPVSAPTGRSVPSSRACAPPRAPNSGSPQSAPRPLARTGPQGHNVGQSVIKPVQSTTPGHTAGTEPSVPRRAGRSTPGSAAPARHDPSRLGASTSGTSERAPSSSTTYRPRRWRALVRGGRPPSKGGAGMR